MTVPTSRVSAKPTNLALKRDGNSITASWKIPSNMSNDKESAHAEFLEAEIGIARSNAKPVYGEISPDGTGTHAMTATGYDHLLACAIGISQTSLTKNYDRNRFHPVNPGAYCKQINFSIKGVNTPGTWVSSGSRWWFKYPGGGYPANTWAYIDQSKGGKFWYFFDKNGWMKTGKITWRGKNYQLSPSGALAAGNPAADTGSWYEFWPQLGRGSAAIATYTFGLPRAPKVSWDYNVATHVATATVETDEGKDQYERYDTMILVKLRKEDGKEVVLMNWSATKSTKWQRSWDLSSYIRNLQVGKWVSIRVWAYARGIAGDNPSAAKAVYAEKNVVFPVSSTPGTVTCDKKAATGRIRVPVTRNGWWVTVQLQRKIDNGSWSDVTGATDNHESGTISLYDSYGSVNPQPGEYVYYRIKTTRDNFTSYSGQIRADCLFTAKPAETCTATCKLASLASNAAGTQVTVVMAWKDGTANTGCELSWSQYPNGWATSEAPTVQQVTGQDGTSKLAGWKTKTYVISGLTSGTDYWVRMRRYKEYSSGTKYSAYDLSGKATKITTESAQDDKCGILSVTTNSTGTTATVIIGIVEDNTNTGTELSWSEVKGAWTSSTETPSTANITATPTTVTDATWKKTWKTQQTATISSLTPGKTYYVRARRYLTSGGTTTYSPYSAIGSIKMESAQDDTCEIVAIPQSGGTVCKLTITPHEDNTNTGTIVQWTDFENGWYSSDSPNELTANWALSSGVQTVWLRGLLPGTDYWVRARRYLESGGTTTYGVWSKVKAFTTRRDTAANDKVGIVSCTPDPSGIGATLVVGYTEDNANIATEVSWSSDSAAWASNQGPSTMEADWTDSKSQSADWKSTQTIYLRGLELGTTYFLKARRYNEDDSGRTWTPYSACVSFSTPSKRENADARCGLVSVEAVDGTTAKVVVGWSGDHSGCEVSWSDDPNAWESSQAPSSFEFDWADPDRQSDDWSNTGTCYIKGLEEGTTYYVKSRSYYEGDARVWSAYSADMSITPFSAPESVVLDAPAAIARGKTIECWWEVSGDKPQTEWHMHDATAPLRAIAEGTGSLCHASIEPERYGDADSVSIYVEAGCGGGLTRSDTAIVAIADVPTCDAACAATLTAQPAQFEVLADDPSVRLLATCYSKGCTLSAPDGDWDQLDGDAVWTQALVPQWTETTWAETATYARISGEVDDAEDAAAAAETAFEATDEYAALQAAISDLETAESDLSSAQTALSDAQAALASAQAALAAAQAILDGLTPEDEGYAEAVAAVEAAEADVEDAEDDVEDAEGDVEDAQEAYDDAMAAQIAAYNASYATSEGIAVQDANAALEAAQAALNAYESTDSVFAATVAMPVSDLYDEGSYRVEFRTVENVAGLASEPAEVEFDVAYSHQAPDPSAGVYSATSDEEVVEGKTYYVQASEYVYTKTEDTSIVSGKTYYAYDRATDSFYAVDEPDVDDLPLYYERSSATVYEPVAHPVTADISSYYEYSAISVDSDTENRKVTIALAAPSGAVSSDVIDVYRQTPMGYELIAQGVSMDSVVTDPHAPFGHADTAYRIACRTVDGDIAWAEFPYSIAAYVLRFDWENESVEFPYNLELRESMSKDYEARSHTDGSVNGYWDRSVELSGSYSTDIIKVEDAELLRKARMLGAYPGAVWVRDAYGKAMQCNVEVNEVSIEYNSKAVGLSFSISAMRTTAQFKPCMEDSNG